MHSIFIRCFNKIQNNQILNVRIILYQYTMQASPGLGPVPYHPYMCIYICSSLIKTKVFFLNQSSVIHHTTLSIPTTCTTIPVTTMSSTTLHLKTKFLYLGTAWILVVEKYGWTARQESIDEGWTWPRNAKQTRYQHSYRSFADDDAH